MILGKYTSSLKRWQLKNIPFQAAPPEDIRQVAQIFHGRDRELEIAIPALYEGRNVLIRGGLGIGKTALILTLLYRLQQEVASIDEQMLVLYIDRVEGESPTDFYRAVLLAVAESLADRDAEAKAIAAQFGGKLNIERKWSREGKVTLGILSYGAKIESPSTAAIDNPYALMMAMLEKAQTLFDRVTIAVDDLDKQDAIVVQTILESSLGLFRRSNRRAFLMTGRGFSDLQEVSLNALGIFSADIKLPRMSEPDLYRIAINHLNLARETPSDDPFPFTEDVLNAIARSARGVPRQLNKICEAVLLKAAGQGCDRLDLEAFTPIWNAVRAEVFQQLSPYVQTLVYIAREAGGLDEDIDDRYLEQLDTLTATDLLPKLKELEDGDILIREEGKFGDRFYPSSLYLPPAASDEDAR